MFLTPGCRKRNRARENMLMDLIATLRRESRRRPCPTQQTSPTREGRSASQKWFLHSSTACGYSFASTSCGTLSISESLKKTFVTSLPVNFLPEEIHDSKQANQPGRERDQSGLNRKWPTYMMRKLWSTWNTKNNLPHESLFPSRYAGRWPGQGPHEIGCALTAGGDVSKVIESSWRGECLSQLGLPKCHRSTSSPNTTRIP